MQILQMIAERALLAPEDADLTLIQNFWQSGRPDGDLRSSDRTALRHVVSALDCVGNALVTRMSSCGAVSYRALPTIKPTTRVRKIPRNFWLEISLATPHDSISSHAVLFIEFDKSGMSLGLKLTGDAQVLGKKTIRTLRRHNRACAVPAKQWRLEKKASPGTENDCSLDLNNWLARQGAKSRPDPRYLAISRHYPPTEASMDVLSGDLNEAATLFGNLLAPKATP